ncbi:MAG TPA: hypothetical protein VKC64_02630, partial [Burkholderiales bacterium]|nr:hypothetical protein [Burkholderiales bacterium]
MSVRLVARGVFTVVVFAFGVARAAEPLTLERALALADEANPRLRAAAAQTEGARAGILTARAYPNP